jgi:hypothetical protein
MIILLLDLFIQLFASFIIVFIYYHKYYIYAAITWTIILLYNIYKVAKKGTKYRGIYMIMLLITLVIMVFILAHYVDKYIIE